MDNKKLAGVCSGLALYLDIDVTLVRILMLVALIFGSAGFWIYVILWIAIPKADTARQKVRNARHPSHRGEYVPFHQPKNSKCLWKDISENVRSQMRKGVLEYCILSILSRKEAYASSILEELKAANMLVVEGTLYPLLIRQKNQGLLSYRWEESTQGPPRKYYVLTDKGREQLAEMDAAWQEMVQSIETLKK